MTADERLPAQDMVEWLESELRGLKARLAELTGQTEQDRTQLWQMADQLREADAGAATLTAQVAALGDLAADVRTLRERLERLQALLGQDQEKRETLARQLRAEVQAEREERTEVGRRAEFAEQQAEGLRGKVDRLEDWAQRLQDSVTVLAQRLEQADLNAAATDARIAANAEAVRRQQADHRTQASAVEGLDRALHDMTERFERMQQAVRRAQEALERWDDLEQEFDVVRGRTDDLRRVADEVSAAVGGAQRDREGLAERLEAAERTVERLRARDTQRDREMTEFQHGLEEAREAMARETERFVTLQEKIRRRQIADLEQEIRELKGYGRTGPSA